MSQSIQITGKPEDKIDRADLEEALNRMETVEHYAHIVYIARKIGRLDFLNKKEIARLNEIRKKYFNETIRG